ncbi:MAG: hypothetical protein JXO72_03370 [Vicinamibacteria bacterium]|nr:hypothetical protein [Vicinamibacteria bacterium]
MKPRSAVQETLLRLTLIAMSLTLTLGALEIAARILRASHGGGKEQAESERYIEYDPLLGWRKKPGARAVYRRAEYTTTVTINSRGLRGPERDYVLPAGVQRILAVGDSYVEAYSVSEERTFVRLLESALRLKDLNVEALNGGTRGYATDQEYLFYVTEGARYAPSIVLLFFYYNDVVYNDRQFYFGMRKPVFEIGTGRLLLHRYPVPPPRTNPAPDPVKPEGDDSAQDVSSSAFLEWVKERLWYGAPRVYDRLGRCGFWPPMPRVAPRTELGVYQRRHVPEIEDAWVKTTRLIAAFDQAVRARGARFLIVGIPSFMEVDDGSWALSSALHGFDETGWDRGLAMQRLLSIGHGLGVPVLDLTPALRRSNRLFRKTYYPRDGHLNSRGHDVVARELERFLDENAWLRDRSSPRPTAVNPTEIETATQRH